MAPLATRGGGGIKRVHQAPTADDRVGVTVHVEIELMVAAGNESRGEANITDVPVTVIGLLGVRGPDLKHVARAVARVRGNNRDAVLRQALQDAPQEDVRRCADTVHESNVIATRRGGDAGSAGRAASVRKSAQGDGAKPGRGRAPTGAVVIRHGPLLATLKTYAADTR